MTHFKLPLKAAAVLGAFAVVAATAPAAFAADSPYSKLGERVISQAQSSNEGRRGTRSDRSTRGDRGARNDRGTRSDRGTRGDRGARDRNRNARNDRGTRRQDRNRRTDRHRTRDYVHLRNNRFDRYDRRGRGYSSYYRPASYRNYRRGHGYRHNGYSSNYRSGLGISFSFGSPGYSSYRWAPSNYGFYRPGRVSYASYRNQTRCNRVVVDGFHYGTLRPVSVKQCYNPWDGYYIVQGSERIAYNAW